MEMRIKQETVFHFRPEQTIYTSYWPSVGAVQGEYQSEVLTVSTEETRSIRDLLYDCVFRISWPTFIFQCRAVLRNCEATMAAGIEQLSVLLWLRFIFYRKFLFFSCFVLFLYFFAFMTIFISTKREENPSNVRTLLNQSNKFFKQQLSEYDKWANASRFRKQIFGLYVKYPERNRIPQL